MMVKALLRRGANVNAATVDGRTALMTAAMHGWVNVVQTLIEVGADANAKDKLERIAIDYTSASDAAVRTTLLRSGSPEGMGRSGRIVCDAQAALNVLGLRTGHPDCWWGTATMELVRKFQKQRGLPTPANSTMRPSKLWK
jgi:hypothetical protein